LGPFLCIGTTLANLNGLENSAWLKSCVSAGAIIGAAICKNLALIWSDPVDLDIYLNESVDYRQNHKLYRV